MEEGRAFALPSDIPSDLAARVFELAPRTLPFTESRMADKTIDWVRCDRCDRWRMLPDGVGVPPGGWECSLNPDTSRNSCDIEEGPEVAAAGSGASHATASAGERIDCISEFSGIGALEHGLQAGFAEAGLVLRLLQFSELDSVTGRHNAAVLRKRFPGSLLESRLSVLRVSGCAMTFFPRL
jgi:hypothetical protein